MDGSEAQVAGLACRVCSCLGCRQEPLCRLFSFATSAVWLNLKAVLYQDSKDLLPEYMSSLNWCPHGKVRKGRGPRSEKSDG